jgi:hypothetical protein
MLPQPQYWTAAPIPCFAAPITLMFSYIDYTYARLPLHVLANSVQDERRDQVSHVGVVVSKRGGQRKKRWTTFHLYVVILEFTIQLVMENDRECVPVCYNLCHKWCSCTTANLLQSSMHSRCMQTIKNTSNNIGPCTLCIKVVQSLRKAFLVTLTPPFFVMHAEVPQGCTPSCSNFLTGLLAGLSHALYTLLSPLESLDWNRWVRVVPFQICKSQEYDSLSHELVWHHRRGAGSQDCEQFVNFLFISLL